LVQKILQKTKSKEKRKENKGLVLGQNQLLMLSSGKIVSVEELRDYSLYPSLISWNDSFTSNSILSIEKSNADILHLISSHGRNIYCSALLFSIDRILFDVKLSFHEIREGYKE